MRFLLSPLASQNFQESLWLFDFFWKVNPHTHFSLAVSLGGDILVGFLDQHP